MYSLIFKRLLDIIFSLLLIILSSPLFLFISFILLITNKGKIFFLQIRPGRYGKNFKVIKFKTMNDLKNSNGELLADGERLTKIGRLLRKTSLDEMPQLLNIVLGEMSFIGPRPLLVKYLPFYTPDELKRHNVRPGITGLAQINGRNNLCWDERLRLDVSYVNNISFYTDLRIVFKTILNVLTAKDVNVDSSKNILDLDETRNSK